MPVMFQPARPQTDTFLTLDPALCAQYSTVFLSTLAARGIDTDEKIRAFLHPAKEQFLDPLLLNGMREACERLNVALEQEEKITIYGDYDVDGVCAVSILFAYLSKRVAHAQLLEYVIPSRQEEGYGLNTEAVRRLAERGTRLIITVDCGISSFAEIETARGLGMDVIVTDHHEPPLRLPECVIVNPKMQEYPTGLCGAGVAWKLVCAHAGIEEGMRYIQLATLATIADIVPLREENRVIVKYGLEGINRHPMTGIHSLLLAAGLEQKLKDKKIRTMDIAFGIAPRLNAAGRMEEADPCVQLLLSNDTNIAHKIATQLNEDNQRRQQLCERILHEANEQLLTSGETGRCLVVAAPGWRHSVVGIVAARLVEQYYRPAFVFEESNGCLTGSARSIEGVNLVEALRCADDLLIKYGGHAKAAGMTLRVEDLQAFRERINAYLESVPRERFVPKCNYDIPISLKDVGTQLAEELELFEPTGFDNHEPCFLLQDAQVISHNNFGRENQHIKLTLSDGYFSKEATIFGFAQSWSRYPDKSRVSGVVTLDTWKKNDVTTVNLKMKVIRPSGTIKELPQLLRKRQGQIEDAFLALCHYNNDKETAVEYSFAEPEQFLQQAKQAFGEQQQGVLLLSSYPEACFWLAQHADMFQEWADMALGSPLVSSGMHTVLFSPERDKIPWSLYSEIYIYDTNPEFILNCLPLKPGTHVVLCRHIVEQRPELNRDTMLRYYSMLRQAREADADKLIETLAQAVAGGTLGALAAVRVFEELRFLSVRTSRYPTEKRLISALPQPEKTELTSSVLYNRLLYYFSHPDINRGGYA